MLYHPITHILIASAVAAALAYFMYYRSNQPKKTQRLFGLLRFSSLFILILLLFNPKIKKTSYESVKTGLPILIDNSSSIAYLKQEESVKNTYSFLKENQVVQEVFDPQFFSFGSEVKLLDSLDFSEGETLLTSALEAVEQLYKDTEAPILLFTDGNQTSGRDYTYYASQLQREVYPVIIGDTTNYPDLRIDKVIANRFSYLHNDFPVEIQTSIHALDKATTELQVLHNQQIVHREPVHFDDGNSSVFTTIYLTANDLGLQTYELRLKALEEEKNLENNSQTFAVDVLDSSGKIALVSDITHPDIGAIKRSLEANSFLEVETLSVEEAQGNLAAYHLVLLYQPQAVAASLVQEIETQGLPVLYITGLSADWQLLNTQQQAFRKPISNHSDEVQAQLDASFDLFLFDEIAFGSLPPMRTTFGMLELVLPHTSVLEQFISGQRSGTTLLAVYEEADVKRGILDAEGIWRWRSAIYEKEKSFESFDSFLQGIVQYLASTEQKKRLQVHFENFYYQNTKAKLRAQYFDTNFQLDREASLEIQIFKNDSLVVSAPMMPSELYQEIGVEELAEASYSFKIIEPQSGEEATGKFEILAYDIEERFTRANTEALKKLADITGGKVLFAEDLKDFLEELQQKKKYQIKEREIIKEESLIHYSTLLILLLSSLALEWFLRKYKGLL